MDEVEQLARRFQALSVSTRIKILGLLKDRCLCVGALAARLDVTQGAVSQHLRILKDAGFVEAERRGNFIHYQLSEEALAEWDGVLGHVFQQFKKKRGRKGEKTCLRRRKAARSQKN